tara:strand:- start:203 stop:634 length:432 start_codon:yes stop_codon:yes gene_type:complete
MFNEKINYYRQVIDEDSLIIGMYGENREEITHRYYAFYNWMATNGELDWRTDKLAVFWTDEKRFRKAVLDIYRTRCVQDLGDTLKGVKTGADYIAVDAAKEFIDSIPSTQELYTYKMRTPELSIHDELVISAEDLSDWDAVKA